MPIQMLSSKIMIRFIAYMAKLSHKGTKSLAHTQANARFLMKNPPLSAKLSTFSQNICVYANFSLPLRGSLVDCATNTVRRAFKVLFEDRMSDSSCCAGTKEDRM